MTGVYRSPEAEAAVRKAYRDLIDSWPVPHDEAMVETRQGATFVLSFGRPEAPPLVALHGAQGNSSAWLSYAGGWAEHFRVHLVDVVGDAGFSDQTRPDLASDAFADWMDQVLDGLGAPAASFVGVSLGGWMALDYAVRRPQRRLHRLQPLLRLQHRQLPLLLPLLLRLTCLKSARTIWTK